MHLSVRECGYAEQAARIANYQALHIPDSVLPYRQDPDDFPDGCLVCGKATAWESRELPNGCLQTRCTECHSVSTFGA